MKHTSSTYPTIPPILAGFASQPLRAALAALALGLLGAALLPGCTQPPRTGEAEDASAQTSHATPGTAAPALTGPSRADGSKPAPTGLPRRQAAEKSGESHARPVAYDLAAAAQAPAWRSASEPVDRENYHHFDDNGVRLVAEAPVSTFSIDVDTGAYSNVRRMLNNGRLPVQDAVRTEELINYFSYDYPDTGSAEQPFSVSAEVAVTPWNPETYLMHIGIRGMDIARDDLPPANLVFLVDVSGSMRSDNKLGLLRSALKLMTRQLREQDTIAIAVYAGASGTVLEPTSGKEKAKILGAIDGLAAGGSTNGAAGIRLAYRLAQQSFDERGINRILLATDGDFNVGTVNFEQLQDLVEQKRASGISLTTLGFGTGNYNDRLMEQLADAGNGNYAYIDTLNEAQKALIDEMSSTLTTIAKDVKIQVEFNPAVIAEYRLIGYENRVLQREDFSNDRVDAGDIGAGHTVTALYEITPVDSSARRLEPLRYGGESEPRAQGEHADEVALLRLRYKQPRESDSRLIETPVRVQDRIDELDNASDDFRFSAAVAAFGQQLRGGRYTGGFDYDDILSLARSARGKDRWGYRGEFIRLVNLAGALSTPRAETGGERESG